MASKILPTAKVTAATAAIAAVELTITLIEWLTAIDVPATVESTAAVLAVFMAGWLAPGEGSRRAVE